MRWIDGTDLVQWADRRDSQSRFPEVVRQLILATVDNLRRVTFRAGEGVQFPGWDGYVEAPQGSVYVPQGVSCWELGTDRNIARKANQEYTDRTANPLGINPADATFIFATPRRWADKTRWAQEKQAEHIWQDVRAYDADDIEPWLTLAPGVGVWFARVIAKYPRGVRCLEDIWIEYSTTTNPPLNEALLLAGRSDEQANLVTWLRGEPRVLRLQADVSEEALAFVAACVAQLPGEEADSLRARVIATRDPEELRALRHSRSRLIILYDGTDNGPVTAAVHSGHLVLVTFGDGGKGIKLSRPSREEFADAIKTMGFSAEDAFALARETGRSIRVLQRRYAAGAVPVLPLPQWAQHPHLNDVIGFLLAGSWDDQRAADRDVIAELTGRPYAELARRVVELCQGAEPPFRQAGTVVAATAPKEAWREVGRAITRDDLQRFAAVAERVLSLEDPRLTLPADERWLAAVRGRVPEHSAALRQGIANTLALFTALGVDDTIPHRAQDVAARVVGTVLEPGVSWQRWYSLAGVLPLLAEAAPNALLTGLEAQLAPEAPEFVRLFDEEGGRISAHSMHTHVLWALEVLAWDPIYLSRVTLVLARLAQIDPGGRLQNRPINSLRSILLFWHPNTSATLEQRNQAIDLLVDRHPDVAWDALTKMLPKSFDTGSVNVRPQWHRVTEPSITIAERYQGMVHILERVLPLAGMNPDRLALLIQGCGSWPPPLRERLIVGLETFAVDNPTPEAAATVWAELRQFVNTHRSHPDAEWALPEAMLAPLAAARARLLPGDLITRHGWLFDDWWPNLGMTRTDDQAATDAAIATARRAAIIEILREQGLAGIIALARAVKYPGFVGRDTADVINGRAEQRALLMSTLGSERDSEQILGRALVSRWHEREGEAWVDEMLTPPVSNDEGRVAPFLLGLPFERVVWARVTAVGGAVEQRYWREARAWLSRETAAADLSFAVERFMGAGRAVEALHLIGPFLAQVPGPLVLRCLAAIHDALAAGAPLPQEQMFTFDLERSFERLRAENVDVAEIARLEWFFLPLLAHGQAMTLTLHRQLAADPALFADIISAVYKSTEPEDDEAAPPTEQEAARARVAYELLSSWHVIPGSTAEGRLDAVALNAWVDDARARSAANGRGPIADIHLGQILCHAPLGPDGIWPPPVVRDLIERLGSRDFDSGLTTGIFNSRGVHARNPMAGGEPERAIAARYNGFADALAGTHPRASNVARAIAVDYERFAAREDGEAQQRDLG
jgi:hypothetical protein